jgi:serine/threonine protein kinase/tetratricopeptide (TPR) repeat protein
VSPFTVGAWRVDAPLGHGGTSEVWAATHEHAGTPAALKVVRRDGTGDPRTRMASLHNELAAIVGLDHPNILRVYDRGVIDPKEALASGGRIPEGAAWIALERASGGSLYTAAPPRTWRIVKQRLTTLLDALGHAHARGVVHRDVKPSNLLLCTSDDLRSGLMLADFGLATGLEALAAGVGQGGTPRYVSPEQARGDARAIGPWSDLYAVGCLAWEWTTGSAPFHGERGRTFLARQTDSALPPFVPTMAVPDGFSAWVHSLLARDPDQRPRYAADALTGLKHLKALGPHVPGAARPVTTADDRDATLDDLATWQTLPAMPSPQDVGTTSPAASAPRARLPTDPPLTEVEGERRVVVPGGLALLSLRDIPLVGRERERRVLWSALRDAVRHRRGRGVRLIGRGARALTQWLAEAAAERGAIEVLRATFSDSPTARDGLAAMFRRHLRLVGLDADARHRALETIARRRDPLLLADVPTWSALLGDTPWTTAPDHAERIGHFVRLLGVVAPERPVLIALHDVGHASEAEAFSKALLNAPGRGVLVVTTTRTAPDGEPTPPGVTTLRLEPLSDDDIAALVQHLAGLSSPIARDIARRAGGDVRFAMRLLDEVVEQAALQLTPQGWTPHPDLRLDLPTTLEDAWERRLERALADLPDATRRSLRFAAVLGRRVDPAEWRRGLAFLGMQPSERLVDRALESFEASGIVTRSSDGWSFGTSEIRALLLRDAERRHELAALHEAAADAIEGADVDAGRSLRHGDHLRDAGQQARAEARWRVGLELALRDASWSTAAALLRRLEGDTPLEALPSALHERAARVAIGLQRFEEARFRGELAERHAEDGASRAAATLTLATLDHHLGDLSAAATRLASPPPADAPPTLAAAHARLAGSIFLQQGEVQAAADAFRRAWAIAQAHHLDVEVARARIGLGNLARLRGDVITARVELQQGLVVLRSAGDRPGIAAAANALGETLRMGEEFDAARDAYLEVLSIDAASGHDTSITRFNLAMISLATGDVDAAARSFLDLEATWSDQGRSGWMSILHVAWLPVLARHGDWDAFRHRLHLARAALEASGFVEPDVAHLAEMAGRFAQEAAQPTHALAAWSLAFDHWGRLGQRDRIIRAHARVTQCLDELTPAAVATVHSTPMLRATNSR